MGTRSQRSPARQRARNLTLLLAFLLFPVTQFYFSPYLIIDGALNGIVSASFLVFMLLLFGGVFIGRAFCGWVMPCGALQELIAKSQCKPVRAGRYRIKWYIWGIWLAAIIAISVRAGGFARIDVSHKLEVGVSIAVPWMFFIYYGVIALMLILSLSVGRRASCHVLCWMAPFMIIGRHAGRGLRVPQLSLIARNDQCIQCGRCTDVCPMSLDVQKMVESARTEHAECILCGVCADECPKSVLTLAFRSSGRRTA